MVKFFQAAGGSYAIYILVIGPHFFQVMSFTFGLSSNFTPCLSPHSRVTLPGLSDLEKYTYCIFWKTMTVGFFFFFFN